MAWFRPMGADEVVYHQATVVGRADDHPGAALDYYGSRGETPLRWGGAGAARLGLAGEVTPEAYEAAYGPGGFRDPATGEQLVATKRPGFELVVSAHKSVAVLGVIDRADAMHSILDVETDATMDWLDSWFQSRGGRRGRAQVRTATGGLVYARTRHGTSRAGDPSPHDHVLVANVAEMLDGVGGFKGLDSASLRDTVEAATMVGRLHSAAQAVSLGYRIEPDNGPSGNLRHWRIAGIPIEVCDLFSKRADEITTYLSESGHADTYRARQVAARESRAVKRHTGVDDLMPTWRAELAAIGWSVERLSAALDAARTHPTLPGPLSRERMDELAAEVLHIDGDLMANHKVFTRTHLVAAVAPLLYGHDPAELDRVVDHILGGQLVVPLLASGAIHERAYATVEVLATEQAIAESIDRLAARPGPALPERDVTDAVLAKGEEIGHRLTPGQWDVVEAVCSSGRAVEVVVGVAGSGKTTALDAASAALGRHGYRVLGASTSGQAARTLGTEAHIESRTITSLLWRLDHDQITFDPHTVVILDEAAMTADRDLHRVIAHVEAAGAKLVLVGDPRQLSSIGPGGALAALLERHPAILTTLDRNVRQRDPAERRALRQLRNGDVHEAIDWYLTRGRTALSPNRTDALIGMVEGWAGEVADGHDTALLAWRRDDVRDLNRLARNHMHQTGRLSGAHLVAPGGRPYAAGDQAVVLAPLPDQGLVTSQRLTITRTHPNEDALEARTTDGRRVLLTGTAIDAEHLDHGYALTIHRAQGATYDRAHVLANGGGRELAYVALSRARTATTLHAIADDLPQLQHDLALDWSNDQHQRWVTDAATPAPPTKADLGRQLAVLNEDLQHLYSGTGRWEHTPQGQAARHLNDVRQEHNTARYKANALHASRRDRRTASRTLDHLTPELASAQAAWGAIGEPVANDLHNDISTIEVEIDTIETESARQRLASLARTGHSGRSIEDSRGADRRSEARLDRGIGL